MPILGTLTWLSSGKHMLPDHVNVAQVASHAQKYFIRLNSMNKKDKRRSSIHDITSVNPANGEIPGVGLFTTSLHALVQFDFAFCIHAVMRVCCPERLWAGYALAISARQVGTCGCLCMHAMLCVTLAVMYQREPDPQGAQTCADAAQHCSLSHSTRFGRLVVGIADPKFACGVD